MVRSKQLGAQFRKTTNRYVHFSRLASCWKTRYLEQAEWFATYNIGASMRLEWIGTDVLLYGFGNQTSYLMLSDSEPNATSVAPTGVEGLLYKQTGLQYGSHWIGLQTIGAPVAIVSAIVTVGMGEPG